MTESVVIARESCVKSGATSLKKKLTTWHIALMVIATAAPLGSIIGNVPFGLIMGGPGLPTAYLIAGAVLLCFAWGYSKLVVDISGEGAFYRCIHAIFGARIGMGSAFVALFSYTALTASVASSVGYFTNLMLKGYGVDWGWQLWTAVAFVLVSVLGRFSADVGAKLLVAIIIVEFFLLVVLDASIGFQQGVAALPLEIFSPANIAKEGFGVALMIGFFSFIGFEAAALYSGETQNPHKAIPAALMIAVFSVAVFYFLSSWLIVGAAGVDQAQGAATKLEGNFVIDIFRQYTGSWVAAFTNFMLCNSIIACYISLHNAATRYAYIIAQNGSLPKILGVINPKTLAPANASIFISITVAIFIAIPAFQGADPYLTVGATTAAMATLGVIALQVIVALGIMIFYRKRKDRRVFSTLVAPGIAFVGLVIAAGLIVDNFHLLSGSESALTTSLPLLLVIVFFIGLSRRPCQSTPL
ncbi:APC family permease [Pseudomonas nabeulensis]|uniref:APC family permease n=1 Tax=Pseudomonas nabeulensis TaxID=2293833 RepID=A0A4Z0AGN0_9PSED|nr:APC family permease [Pseudomonas nabeulensis]TFY85521.1 APC family permease [Pseudomonas nabeulensis]